MKFQVKQIAIGLLFCGIALVIPIVASLKRTQQEAILLRDGVGHYDVQEQAEQKALKRLSKILQKQPIENNIQVSYSVSIRKNGHIGFLLASVIYRQKEKVLIQRKLMPFQSGDWRTERITYKTVEPGDIDTAAVANCVVSDIRRYKPSISIKRTLVPIDTREPYIVPHLVREVTKQQTK